MHIILLIDIKDNNNNNNNNGKFIWIALLK